MTKDEVIEMINASSCSPSEKWKLVTAVDRLPDAAINPCSAQLPPDFLPVLIENRQAMISGYYNVDTTDEERKTRKALIAEYTDLISIYKHNQGGISANNPIGET